ncbi:MAG: class I SAM-dependent methyltransferase [Planctomycetota bacterium]|nr:MAG: class I SAM-dependent methyltransferase [Planctomycetota bacterium]
MSKHAYEVAGGRRYEFGENWRRFLARLTPRQIDEAGRSLSAMLGRDSLTGQAFLDIGSGSGLFSLAARKLGARVHSFDYDPRSVACTRALKDQYFAEDSQWTIEEGSVLDRGYIESLGRFDVVYAWGVLHHTGALEQAMNHAALPVAAGGQLYVAIYNYQPIWTRFHTAVKRTYVASPRPLRAVIAGGSMAFHATRGLVKDLVLLRDPTARYRNYNRLRGMSWWHDQLDWIGGYPFEAATPDDVQAFYRQRDFELERMTTCGKLPGCNEFVFRRRAHDA